MSENIDFVLVPEDAWTKLINWYSLQSGQVLYLDLSMILYHREIGDELSFFYSPGDVTILGESLRYLILSSSVCCSRHLHSVALRTCSTQCNLLLL